MPPMRANGCGPQKQLLRKQTNMAHAMPECPRAGATCPGNPALPRGVDADAMALMAWFPGFHPAAVWGAPWQARPKDCLLSLVLVQVGCAECQPNVGNRRVCRHPCRPAVWYCDQLDGETTVNSTQGVPREGASEG
jgi:hypothetical protein